MTQEKYRDMHYVGKHIQHEYQVWVVAGPAGPEYTFTVIGLDNARQAIVGAWDWEITRLPDKEQV